jgi:hypothetical protein
MLKSDNGKPELVTVAVNVTEPSTSIVLDVGASVNESAPASARVNNAGEQKSPKLTIAVHVSALNCMTHSELNAAQQRY